jgi:hypothetical protein
MVMMVMPYLKHRQQKFLVIISLALIITTPLLAVHSVAAQSTDYIEKSFSWDYEGRTWNWNLSIPNALYNEYKSVPVSARTHNGPAGYGYLTTTEDYYMITLANKLNQTATNMGYSSYDKVSFVLAFVQSLQYTSDNVTEGYNEYPRFPIETLVDDGGDCEDTSILFATITIIMGYGTVYISPPNHYAVGILGNNLYGTYWEHPQDSNRTFYYCETTGNGFKIGQLPDEFKGQSASIYDIDQRDQYIPKIAISPITQPTPTNPPLTTTSTTPSVAPTRDVSDPTTQPPLELSLNLIFQNPLLFILITFAVVVSITLATMSVRKPKNQNIPETTSLSSPLIQGTSSTSGTEANKFCIYCGSGNKAHAAYCEKCGKQIS